MRFTDRARRAVAGALAGLALASALAAPAQAAERVEIGSGLGTLDFAIGNSKIFRTTGSFGDWRGTIKVDDADVASSSVDVTVNTRSIQMLDSQQTEMLKTGDFFDTDRFPEMSFRSTKVERTGDHDLRVEGTVTLRGVSRPMTMTVTVSDQRPEAAVGDRYARFRGFATLKRSEFGMSKFVDMVGDTVEISIATDGRRR